MPKDITHISTHISVSITNIDSNYYDQHKNLLYIWLKEAFEVYFSPRQEGVEQQKIYIELANSKTLGAV